MAGYAGSTLSELWLFHSFQISIFLSLWWYVMCDNPVVIWYKLSINILLLPLDIILTRYCPLLEASFNGRSEQEGESTQRCRARLERYRRTAERAVRSSTFLCKSINTYISCTNKINYADHEFYGNVRQKLWKKRTCVTF